MAVITKENYDSLSPEEQAVVAKLGIRIDQREKKDVFEGKKIVQAYVTLVESTCRLCSEVSVSAFSMEGVGTTLISRQIDLLEITADTEVHTRKEKTVVCGCCRDNLITLSRENLVELAIKAAKGMLY